MVIFASCEFGICRVHCLICSSKFEFLGISQLLELIWSLLSFEKIIVDSLDLGIIILTLFFFESYAVSKSINLVLVLCLLFSEFAKFILEVISIFPQSIGLVVLNANLSLECNAFLFSPADLVSYGANFSLIFIVRSVLFVKKESEILNFFSESIWCDNVLIMSVIIIVILHEFFIL
jgi:hypothetical protein